MALAIFDLDNTLLCGDSDHLWGEFIAENDIVDESYMKRNDAFLEAYQEGRLDILNYLEFCLEPLASHELATLNQWHQQFMEQKIKPIILPAGLSLISQHRERGDYILIITATNSFVTSPIAKALDVDDIIATEPELVNGRYTGKVNGTPSFQAGKIIRLEQWLQANPHSLDGSYFYSDSHNDIPLLEKVSHPVAVDPDAQLQAIATQQDWPVISLRSKDYVDIPA
ncbi:MAG: HAD-IB family hydrolase [Kangiellaceae bacterium]|nr:HAD-IB family hydrolase [Kangiellaceae bacterium]|tara:strand:+ start:20825 stop:21502 length:678 start_codon:yes stop_codon:yes gene_type:complete